MDDLEWIKEALEKPGKTQRGLAQAMGIDATAVNRMLKGKRAIKANELPAIRRYLMDDATVDIHRNASPEGLVATRNSGGVELLPGARPPLTRDLPIRGHSKAGETGFFIDQGQTWGFAMRPESLRGVANAYAVRVHDVSMEPRFQSGETLQVDPHRQAKPGDDVVIQLTDGQCFVKRLVRRAAGAVVVKQFNPPQEIEWKAAKVASIHLVVGVDYLER